MAYETKCFADDGREVVAIYRDKSGRLVGWPKGEVPTVYTPGQGWNHTILTVQRKVDVRVGAPRHECDARCINATGRVMRCECSCGGRNHGKGRFNCSAAA